MESVDRGLTARVGPLQVDVPRSAGYFGGVALAVGAGLIEPPLGLFIASIPFFKMLNRPSAPRPARWVGQLLDGMSKPVGGASEGTVELRTAALPRTLRGPDTSQRSSRLRSATRTSHTGD